MRFQDIKTEDQFWEFANNQYNRMHNLREVWQNTTETFERRKKAHKLWYIMKERVKRLATIGSSIHYYKLKDFDVKHEIKKTSPHKHWNIT